MCSPSVVAHQVVSSPARRAPRSGCRAARRCAGAAARGGSSCRCSCSPAGPGRSACSMPSRPGAQHHRERQVRIARRIGHAQLDARVGAARRRHAHERAAVRLGPGDGGRRFVAGHEPLVRVHQRIGDRAERLRRAAAGRRCSAGTCGSAATRPFGVEEHVRRRSRRATGACACPMPLMPKIGLGMNVACRPLRLRHVLHDEAERADVVGRRQRIVVAEVDLVLARAPPRGARPRRESPSARAPGRSRGGRPRPDRPGVRSK